MHHKRKRPKSTRSGCLMCKPWKRQGSCVIAIVVAAILMASPFLLLAGCQGYQPPGQDIWRAL